MAKKAELSRGEKVAKTRKENETLRKRINDMNSVQKAGFFAGFSGKDLAAIEKAIAAAKKSKSKGQLRKLEAKRAEIEAQIAALQG